jgi:hypothetical protein
MDPIENYNAVVASASVALLLVASGLAKKQLVWKPRSVPLWRRRRRSA